MSVQDYLSRLRTRVGASEEDISALSIATHGTLPQDYLRFMAMSDGCTGFAGPEAFIRLFTAKEVLELHSPHTDQGIDPGIMVFGSNGGETAYAFDLRGGGRTKIIGFPQIGIEADQVEEFGNCLEDLLRKLSTNT